MPRTFQKNERNEKNGFSAQKWIPNLLFALHVNWGGPKRRESLSMYNTFRGKCIAQLHVQLHTLTIGKCKQLLSATTCTRWSAYVVTQTQPQFLRYFDFIRISITNSLNFIFFFSHQNFFLFEIAWIVNFSRVISLLAKKKNADIHAYRMSVFHVISHCGRKNMAP